MPVPIPPARVIERERVRYARNSLTFPEDIGAHGMLFIFRDYNFLSARNAGLLRRPPAAREVGDTVLLPLPKNLQNVTSLNVQGSQLSTTGESLATVLGSMNNANSVGGLSSAAYNAVMSQLPSGADLGGAFSNFMFQNGGAGVQNVPEQIAFLLRKTLDGFNLSRAADAGLGSVVNPKAALSFEGVNLKPHSFSWDLAVKTRRESDTVRNIFQTINRNALPEYIPIGTGTEGNTVLSRALLRYPSMVDVFLMGVDASYYFFFKTAMVQSVSVNFSPNGNVVMEGGKPGIMTLDIQLMEADIHTAEDYGNDNAGGVTQNTLRG